MEAGEVPAKFGIASMSTCQCHFLTWDDAMRQWAMCAAGMGWLRRQLCPTYNFLKTSSSFKIQNENSLHYFFLNEKQNVRPKMPSSVRLWAWLVFAPVSRSKPGIQYVLMPRGYSTHPAAPGLWMGLWRTGSLLLNRGSTAPLFAALQHNSVGNFLPTDIHSDKKWSLRVHHWPRPHPPSFYGNKS